MLRLDLNFLLKDLCAYIYSDNHDIMISPRCSYGIPQCTEHPLMYSWYPPDILMASPRRTEHPYVLNTHYTGWIPTLLTFEFFSAKTVQPCPLTSKLIRNFKVEKWNPLTSNLWSETSRLRNEILNWNFETLSWNFQKFSKLSWDLYFKILFSFQIWCH